MSRISNLVSHPVRPIVKSIIETNNINAIGGNNLLLDPAVFSSLTFNGPDISKIDDLSGNGNHYEQASPSDQFFYETNAVNGLPALQCDGVSEFMRCVKEYVSTDSDTWFFVFQADADGLDSAALFADYGDDIPSRKLILFEANNSAPIDGFFVRDVSSNSLRVTKTFTTAYSLLILTRKPGEITIDYNDSTGIATGTYASTDLLGGTVGSLGAQLRGGGDSDPNVSTFLKGHISYALRYDSVLSSPNIFTIKNFLKTRFAL